MTDRQIIFNSFFQYGSIASFPRRAQRLMIALLSKVSLRYFLLLLEEVTRPKQAYSKNM